MPNTLLPIAPLVATGWLSGVSALSGISVTQTLPDAASWGGDIAITVAVVPGSPDLYTPLRSTIVQVDVWGKSASGDSRRAPWNRCYAVAEEIREACYGGAARIVTLAGEYKAARVTDVACDREPYRVPPDASGLARVLLQIRLTYTVI